MNTPKEHYRGNLPHFQQPGQWYFITCTLAGAIPKNVQLSISENFRNASERYHQIKSKIPSEKEIKPIKQEYYEARKKYFRAQEHILHNSSASMINLVESKNLKIIEDALRFWEGKRLHNHAWCIMPNHFHWVVSLFKNDENKKPVYLQDITHSIKRFTARQINKNENKEGQFWIHESFETTIRNDQHFVNVVDYTLNNPVKAGFVDDWRKWHGSYLEPDLIFNNVFSDEFHEGVDEIKI